MADFGSKIPITASAQGKGKKMTIVYETPNPVNARDVRMTNNPDPQQASTQICFEAGQYVHQSAWIPSHLVGELRMAGRPQQDSGLIKVTYQSTSPLPAGLGSTSSTPTLPPRTTWNSSVLMMLFCPVLFIAGTVLF